MKPKSGKVKSVPFILPVDEKRFGSGVEGTQPAYGGGVGCFEKNALRPAFVEDTEMAVDDRSPASVATTASCQWNRDETIFISDDRISRGGAGVVGDAAEATTTRNSAVLSAFTSSAVRPVQTRSWMANTRDTSIWKLCFPATHNSATYHIRAQGALYVFSALITPFCKCQALSILDQLYVGIRFLDLRVRRGGYRENFLMFCGHGGILTVPLYEVLKQVRVFLESNKSEVILLSIRYDTRQSSVRFDCHDIDALIYYYLFEFLGPIVTPEDTVGSMVDRGHNLIYFWNDKERVFPQHGPFGRAAGRKCEKRRTERKMHRKIPALRSDNYQRSNPNTTKDVDDVCVIPNLMRQQTMLSSEKYELGCMVRPAKSLAAILDRPMQRAAQRKRAKSIAAVNTAELRKLWPAHFGSGHGGSMESTSGHLIFTSSDNMSTVVNTTRGSSMTSSGHHETHRLSTSSLPCDFTISKPKAKTLDRRKYIRWSATAPRGWTDDSKSADTSSSSTRTMSHSGSRRASPAMRIDAVRCNVKRRNDNGIGIVPPRNTNTIKCHKRASSAREVPSFQLSEVYCNRSDAEVLGERRRRLSRRTQLSWKNWIKESVAHHKSELEVFENKKRLHVAQRVKPLSPCFFGKSIIEKSWSSTCDHNPSNLCEKLVKWGNQIECRKNAPYSFRVLAAEVTAVNPDKRATAIKYWSSQALKLCFGQPVGLDVAADETHELLLKGVLTEDLLSVANVVSHDFVNPAVVQRVIDWNITHA